MSEIAPFLACNNSKPPRGLGQRYDAQRFLPEEGNTVVCHLDQDDETHQAVIEARQHLMTLPGADRFLHTPVSSLHMTVFEGVLETRRTADTWPAPFDPKASVQDATDMILGRLHEFSAPPVFNVRVAALRPTGLILTGATSQDLRWMRAWRDALTAPFGYRHTHHDSYAFHMTFAYPVDWLPDRLHAPWEHAFATILSQLQQAAPVIPLRAPAFCTFADMTHFHERLVLAP